MTSDAFTGETAAYAEHWDRWHDTSANREWHTDWPALRPIVQPHLEHAATQPADASAVRDNAVGCAEPAEASTRRAAQGGTILDVGCGQSTLAFSILQAAVGYTQAILLDASPKALAALQSVRTSASATPPATATASATPSLAPAPGAVCVHKGSSGDVPSADDTSGSVCDNRAPLCVDMLLSDCRIIPLRSGSVQAVLDKGTIDALWSDEDKVRMLEACARVVARPHGVIVSVSFASPVRLRLLWTHARRLNLCLRVYITAKGDPARGHEARFVALLSESWPDTLPYQPDALTQLLLVRLIRTGSLMDTDADTDTSTEDLPELGSDAFWDALCSAERPSTSFSPTDVFA